MVVIKMRTCEHGICVQRLHSRMSQSEHAKGGQVALSHAGLHTLLSSAPSRCSLMSSTRSVA